MHGDIVGTAAPLLAIMLQAANYMADAPKQYVMTDEHGVMRVAGTRVMLDSVIAAWKLGSSAESIQDQYPSLSLEQVYGSIAYMLANPEEVAAYIREQDEFWAKMKAQIDADPSPVIARLRGMRRSAELPSRS